MIDLYTWATPNGRKVSILLEELNLSYLVHEVNIGNDEQFSSDFLKISPNNKIPAIVDHEGPDGEPISIFESGAILIYLCEKTARDDLWPSNGIQRLVTLQWLMFQMSGIGPFLGQANHFLKFSKEEVPYAKDRYRKEAHRIYNVLENRLSNMEYLAGKNYTLADIAAYPWVKRYIWHDIDIQVICPHIWNWLQTIESRDAVKRGMLIP